MDWNKSFGELRGLINARCGKKDNNREIFKLACEFEEFDRERYLEEISPYCEGISSGRWFSALSYEDGEEREEQANLVAWRAAEFNHKHPGFRFGLAVDYNGVDIDLIPQLVGADYLEISYNGVRGLSKFSGLVNLKILNLEHNKIRVLKSLSKLVNLEQLHLGYNEIEDISPLSKLVNLKYLYLSNNKIKDVSPLAKLVNLEYLNLKGNKVKNLDCLSHLKAEIII